MISNRPKFILVIEDNEELSETVCSFLEMNRYKTVSALDGFKALQKISLQEFDCIICDISLPKMQGDEVIHQIRKSKFNAKTPIIVLSGNLDKDVILDIKNEVQKVFTKPVEMPVLVEAINALCKKKEAAR